MAIFDIDQEDQSEDPEVPHTTTTEIELCYEMDRLRKELAKVSTGLTVYCPGCYKPVKCDITFSNYKAVEKGEDKDEGPVCGGWKMKCPHCGKEIYLIVKPSKQ